MLAKAAITTSRVTYAKMEKRNLPLLPRVASIIWPMVLPSKRMEEYRAPKSCTPPKKMLPIKIHSITGTQPNTAAVIGPTIGPAPAMEEK